MPYELCIHIAEGSFSAMASITPMTPPMTAIKRQMHKPSKQRLVVHIKPMCEVDHRRSTGSMPYSRAEDGGPGATASTQPSSAIRDWQGPTAGCSERSGTHGLPWSRQARQHALVHKLNASLLLHACQICVAKPLAMRCSLSGLAHAALAHVSQHSLLHRDCLDALTRIQSKFLHSEDAPACTSYKDHLGMRSFAGSATACGQSRALAASRGHPHPTPGACIRFPWLACAPRTEQGSAGLAGAG